MSPAGALLPLEPDHLIRYAIWRLCALARGRDPLAHRARQVRLEIFAGTGALPRPVLRIEDAGGMLLEQVFCEEHLETFIPPEAVRRFLADVALARERSVEPGARYRWVTNARLSRQSPDARVRDLADPADRREFLARASLDSLDGADVLWDHGRHSTTRLSAEGLFQLSLGRAEDVREIYQDLYESLRALLSANVGGREEQLRQNLLLYLYGESRCREPSLLAGPGAVSFWRQRLLPLEEAAAPPIDQSRIAGALRRGLFPETEVTLEDLYVSQQADLLMPDEAGKRSLLWSGDAQGLMFWWLSEVGRRDPKPLLVLGSFGSGKSSLLTIFAQSLLDAEFPVVPLLVPLRDLTGANAAQPLKEVLIEHVRDRWGVDLAAATPGGRRYCLLCDGFDELNLYYQSVTSDQWVSDCFRSLCVLAERSDLEVVIASRPSGNRAVVRQLSPSHRTSGIPVGRPARSAGSLRSRAHPTDSLHDGTALRVRRNRLQRAAPLHTG